MFETGIKPIGKGLIPLYYTTQFLNCILNCILKNLLGLKFGDFMMF
jgi:hypothetical protein